MKEMLGRNKKNISSAVWPLVIGILFVLGTIAWYKQYTYFHYASVPENATNDRTAIVGTEEVTGDDGEIYTKVRYGLIYNVGSLWEICVENTGDADAYYDLYDYQNYWEEVPPILTGQKIAAGETIRIPNEVVNPRGILVNVYCRQAEDAQYITVTADDHALMTDYKKVTYLTLAILMLLSLLAAILRILVPQKDRVNGRIFLGISILALITAEVFCLQLISGCYTVGASIIAVEASVLAILFDKGREEDVPHAAGDHERLTFAALISTAVSLLTLFCMLSAGKNSPLYVFNSDNRSNVKDYILIVILFGVFFLLMEWVICIKKAADPILSHLRGGMSYISVIALIVIVLSLCKRIVGGPQRFPIDDLALSQVRWVVAMIVLLAVMALSVRKYPKGGLKGKADKGVDKRNETGAGKKNIVRIIEGILAAAAVLVTGLKLTVINPYDSLGNADVYHVDWYIKSLYNIAVGKPFAGGALEMYGHYALFYKIPFLLFGADMRTIGIVGGVVGAIMMLAAIGCLFRFVQNKGLRIVGIITIFSVMTISGRYPMIFPHRMVFPFLLLYIALCTEQEKEKGNAKGSRSPFLPGYLAAMLGLIWSTDTGIVCALAWGIFVAVCLQKGRDRCIRSLFIEMIRQGLYLCLEILVAYALIKVYNILALGSGASMEAAVSEILDWKKETGVLFSEEFMESKQFNILRWKNGPWLYLITGMLLSAAWYLHRLGLFGKSRMNDRDASGLMLTVLMIGYFTDWMSRPEEYNIIAPLAVLGLITLLDRVLRSSRLHGHMTVCAVVFILFWTADALATFPYALEATVTNLTETKQLDYAAYTSYVEYFGEQVPEGAVAEGDGLRFIYLALNRPYDNTYLGSDYLEPEPTEEVEYYVSSFAQPEHEEYVLVKEIPFGRYMYYLYRNSKYDVK